MAPAAQTAGKRSRLQRWRPVVLGLLALPVLALALGNGLLATPWACRWLATRIQRHSGGLEARIDRANFTPWHGFSITGLELLQPPPLRHALRQPLLRIDSLRIHPFWWAWLQGRYEVKSIELDSPQLVLPVELLAHLVQTVPSAPVTAALPPRPPAVVPVPPASPAAIDPPATVAVRAEPPVAAAISARPTLWLTLKNASFSVVHAESQRVLLAISRTHGSIPLAGDAAASSITIGSVSLCGQPVATDLSAPLTWKSPQLALAPVAVKSAAHSCLIAAKLGIAPGLPLQIEAQLPRQKLAPLALPHAAQLQADAITAAAHFRGLLLAPATWLGELTVESTCLTARVAAQTAIFDRGHAIAILRGGALSCVDARLIGDEISLLGNATLLADGRVAAAARLVATPETLAAIAHQAFPTLGGHPSLTPLSTPQRAAFDLEASGSIHQIFLQLGADGPVVGLNL